MASMAGGQNGGGPGEGSGAPRMPPPAGPTDGGASPVKKRKSRSGNKRKKKNRRQSFAASSEASDLPPVSARRPSLLDVPETAVTPGPSPFGLAHKSRSSTSLESEALLDHRDQPHSRPRRPSVLSSAAPLSASHAHLQPNARRRDGGDESAGPHASADASDRTPLITQSRSSPVVKRAFNYGAAHGSPGPAGLLGGFPRQKSAKRASSMSSSNSQTHARRGMPSRQLSTNSIPHEEYDVNNPPSVPPSPLQSPEADGAHEMVFPDLIELPHSASPDAKRSSMRFQDSIIDMGDGENVRGPLGGPLGGSVSADQLGQFRRKTMHSPVEDVCLPFDQATDLGEEESVHHEGSVLGTKRRSRRAWPDLDALDEWVLEEKEERMQEGIRAKKVSDPVLVGGRLRPSKVSWQREEEEATFRFTYFNEELDTSLKSYTLSGLQELGMTFRELFIPDPPELEDDDDDEEDEAAIRGIGSDRPMSPSTGPSQATTRQPSLAGVANIDTFQSAVQASQNASAAQSNAQSAAQSAGQSAVQSSQTTPRRPDIPPLDLRPKRYGPRPVFWLDVLQPTYEEMRVLSRTFGIHKLTAEDIMEQEAREKVELFRHYYFVNYRTFEQDSNSDEYLDPVNMYFVVFKGGVISFHFSQMPHPPNVRRRIRQLAEHQYTDSDWISYAIIDNITDAYAPLIEQIEAEVDEIDDEILRQNSTAESGASRSTPPTPSGARGSVSASQYHTKHSMWSSWSSRLRYRGKDGRGDYEKIDEGPPEPTGRDMLLRVGECRKRVMGLYRLLGNKADVIKGLAKRCNEQYEVAPRSDVGLYLGDIQDHIVTMTGNLTHYENILSRAHSNYLAQINIRMSERAEQTNDVLGKLTVLGTIVLPMNIITGLWGMNVLVPGQVEDNPTLWYFWLITAGLFAFGFTCFFVARKLYRVV